MRKAIIMAGGEGKRLRPLTYAFPKPLLTFEGDVLIDRILVSLVQHKFTPWVVVNYMGDAIKEHVAYIMGILGKEFKIINEQDYSRVALGTAGILPAIVEPEEAVLVMNADLIIKGLDFDDMWRKHEDSGKKLTLLCVKRNHAPPYGVVDIEDGEFKGIREKPVSTFWANGGVYVVNGEVLTGNFRYLDMPDLISSLGYDVGVYCHEGEWQDVGRG